MPVAGARARLESGLAYLSWSFAKGVVQSVRLGFDGDRNLGHRRWFLGGSAVAIFRAVGEFALNGADSSRACCGAED